MLTLEDEHEITRLLTRYATGIDRRDWPLFRTCFTADVKADYGDFGTWNTADAITEFMIEGHKERGTTLHRLSNIDIGGDGPNAKARTYVDAVLMPLHPGDAPVHAIGYYDDELVKTAEGWKIRARRFTGVTASGIPAG